jgi:predicted HTH domain antitoxin
MVTVTIDLPDLPPELEEELKSSARDVVHDVKEAYALELYRQEKINHVQLSRLLGLDRFETSALLQKHKIYVGALTMDDLEADYQTLSALFKKAT